MAIIEIWAEEGGQEIFRRTLSAGQYTLGRADENEISIANRSLSRRHLQLDIAPGGVQVTDLGSTNGTRINGQALPAHRAVDWSLDDPLYLGPVAVHGRELAESQAQPTPTPIMAQPGPAQSGPAQPAGTGTMASPTQVASIVCSQGVPQVITVRQTPVYVGSHPTCAMRLNVPQVASHHCLLQPGNGQIQVMNLDPNNPARLGGEPIPVGQSRSWQPPNQLQIGGALLHLSFGPATVTHDAVRPKSSGWRSWLSGTALAAVVGLLFLCLTLGVFGAWRGAACGGLDLGCMLAFGSGDDGGPIILGQATPTLKPLQTRPPVTATPQILPSFESPTLTSAQAAAPVDCSAEQEAVSGWIDLPFPYRGTEPVFGGTADLFRRVSQRSRFGGRLNSFFDHQFPIYPPIFGGHEPETLDKTLVTFSGEEVNDAFSQDANSGDWYSGHAGIDYAPSQAREPTTPILAAADGRLALAQIDNDGNHMVWLEHDPDGDGKYQYATLYFHLHPDEFFFAITQLEEGAPIQAGQRIGTMGTTGRSTGIHLHFEVRHDVNGDGRFTLFERVDPYGFFPSEEIAADPWAQLTVFENWLNSRGEPVQHDGIVSDYMWVHPLVDVIDTAGTCNQPTGLDVQVDLFPVLGFGVVNSGFTYVARDDQGNVLLRGQPHLRGLTILPEFLEDVDFDTLSLQRLDPRDNRWRTVTEGRSIEPYGDGGYVFNALVEYTGRYVLVARETVDRVPPVTFIDLAGESIPDPGGQGITAFRGVVEVTLRAQDRGEGSATAITSGVESTQYSLDCGQTWTDYSGPFEVTLDVPHTCGETGIGLQGIELGPNDIFLLAVSEDSENNIEQPAAQARFTLTE